MADTNDRVMAMVEKELQADPEISNEDLRTKAEKLDEGVARMSARQFNARYPLQVKRRLRPRRSGGRKSARRGAGRKRGGKTRAAGGAKRGRPAGAGRKARRPAAAKSARATRGGQEDGTRGRVRATMLDFARDLASADGAGLVDVIAGVDGYVDRVLEATGRS
ncbi:MAG TPA: hypothetical protein VMN78_13190 [Longimicrobiales bacterium]|nr:hypothetical protein [Longimicrobiales bacterium]